MNESTCTLRLAGTDDIDSVYRLVQETIRTCYPAYYTPSVTEGFCQYHNRESIVNDIVAQRVFVVVDDSAIVGTATIEGSYIGRVYVAPESQGKGYGTLLMDAMEEFVAATSPRATLDTSVPGKGFYLHRGYVVTRSETWDIEPYGDLPADQLIYEVMEKSLES